MRVDSQRANALLVGFRRLDLAAFGGEGSPALDSPDDMDLAAWHTGDDDDWDDDTPV